MSEKKQKLPLIESIKLNWRAFSFLFQQVPMVFISNIVQSVFTALTPYVGIYLSARLIDELSGNRNPQKLMFWTGLVLGTALVFGVSNVLIAKWRDTKNLAWWYHELMCYTKKMLYMDFSDMDDSKTHSLYDQIIQNTRWYGWGLEKIRTLFRQTLDAIMNILGAVTLSVTLFTHMVPESAGVYTVMNHPLFTAVMLGIMFVSIVLAPLCYKKDDAYTTEMSEERRLVNRQESFFC